MRRPSLDQLLTAAMVLVAVAASAAYGLTFGFTYGVNNQVEYLLGAKKLVDPGLFANDWLASHTLNYHQPFAVIGWFLYEVGGPGGWGIGVACVVAAAAGAMAVFWLARSMLPRALVMPVFFLTLTAMVATGTREVASTYAFDPIFQPSTVASACLLLSLAPFVQGRWLLSGLILGFGGLIHANYLVLGLATYGLAHLMLGGSRADFVHRVTRHLGPSVVALLLLSPIILKATRASADLHRAHEILFDVRSPHHYHVHGWLQDFFYPVAWQALGLGAGGWILRRGGGRGRRLAAVLVGLLVVIWGGTVLSILGVDRATELFVWRFTPHTDLLMQLLVSATVACVVVLPEAPVRVNPTAVGLTLLGGSAVLVVNERSHQDVVGWLGWLLAATLAGVALRAAFRFTPAAIVDRARPVLRRYWPWVAAAVAANVFVAVVRPQLRTIELRSNLFHGMGGDETDVYRWLRANTPKDAVVLCPPGLERFRFESERAIVVDWKGVPYAAPDLIEWYDRLEAISGRRGFRTRDEVVAGYDAMDAARLEALRSRYGLSYAVVFRGRDAGLGHTVAYSNRGFVVLDLR